MLGRPEQASLPPGTHVILAPTSS